MKNKLYKRFNINSLAVIPLFLMVIFIGIIFYLAVSEQWIFKTSELSEKQINQIISRSETFNISGGEAGIFLEITFTPFQLKEGEEQTITLMLRGPKEDIKSVRTILKDGSGAQEKDFVLLGVDAEENTVSYQIVWQPKYLVLGALYPVEFKYQIKSGGENKMILFWDAAF